MHAQLLSHVQLFTTQRTIAHQVPLSMGFSRQEYWSRLLFPPPGYLPDSGIEPFFFVSPALAGRFFTPRATWKDMCCKIFFYLSFLFFHYWIHNRRNNHNSCLIGYMYFWGSCLHVWMILNIIQIKKCKMLKAITDLSWVVFIWIINLGSIISRRLA